MMPSLFFAIVSFFSVLLSYSLKIYKEKVLNVFQEEIIKRFESGYHNVIANIKEMFNNSASKY
jgi:hypothetical protein